VEYGIEMIHELGYEAFTFKKLGSRINSNESSIYRYFESKHSFLVYLLNWYWSWIEYKLVFATTNIESEEEKLEKEEAKALKASETAAEKQKGADEAAVKIIIAESSKVYHTKEVEKENEKGFYKTYTRVVDRVTEFVLGVNPNFKYPHMLISLIIEGAHHQRYFSKHLPALTDCEEGKNNIVEFYKKLVTDTLKR
jgi:AcrR family transcriptional regulator